MLGATTVSPMRMCELHAAAALAHAAGLTELDVEAPVQHRRVGDDCGGHDHALPPDADDHDVVDHAAVIVLDRAHVTPAFAFEMAPGLQSC